MLKVPDLERRLAVEQELAKEDIRPSFAFDETGDFVIYPTQIGLKVYNIKTNETTRVLGKTET